MVQTVLDQPGVQAQVPAPLRGSESYSSLTMYERCPRSYAFRYVERLPGHVPPGRFAFGSAIHRALETYVRERTRADAPGPTDRTSGPSWPPVTRCSLAPGSSLMSWRASAPPRGRCWRGSSSGRRSATRHPSPPRSASAWTCRCLMASAPSASWAMSTGSTGRQTARPSSCDYKTGRTRSQVEVDADRQLTAYAYAAAQGALRDPASGAPLPPATRLGLYFTDEGVEVGTTRTAADLARFEQDLVEMVTLARQGRFEPRPERWSCHWCEYRQDCPDAIAVA